MLLLSLAILASRAGSTAATATRCDVDPFRVAIQDTQVLPDVNGSYMIGLRANIGSPAQSILMLPWAELNNTWIYDYNPYCDDTVIWSDLICHVRRGDFFYDNASTSWVKTTNLVAAGGATQETDYTGSETGIADLLSQSLDGQDSLSLGSANLTSFPIGVPRLSWDHGYTTLHALGLGSNSTFLKSLVDAGQIASRVWSIFWGRMWIDDWLDGSVVFGGYDSDLTLGENYTDALDYSNDDGTGCWTGMKVTISNIILNGRDGTDESIFPKNYALPACIVPQRQLLLEGPGTILENFETATGMNNIGSSYGLHWSAQQYLAENAYDGDLTISLSSGLSVRVPNSQFMTPFVQIGYDGARFYNESIKEFLYNSVGNQPATLGRYFLTAAYLMVNHDANSFTLWQGNPATSSTLVPVLDEETAAACGTNTSGVVQQSATATASASSSSGDDDASSSSGGISTGAIAGAAVGGVAALAVIAGIIAMFLLKRRRQQRATGASGLNAGENDSITPAQDHAQGSQAIAGDARHFDKEEKHYTGETETHELGGSKPPAVYEMTPGFGRGPSEIDGRASATELPAASGPAHASPPAVHEMDGNSYAVRS